MGDYLLGQSRPTGTSNYGPATTGTTYPRLVGTAAWVSGSGWGSEMVYNAASIRVSISGTGTAYVRVMGSVTVVASASASSAGLAIYKNGSKISTGALSQFLGGIGGVPTAYAIQWVGSVINGDFIQLYYDLPTAGGSGLSSASDAVLTIQQIGGSSLTTNTSLNSCNPQWSYARLTANSGTALGTTEVDVLNYLPTVTVSSGDAINNPPNSVTKPGVYLISVFINGRQPATGTALNITIRLKIGGSILITRVTTIPNAGGSYGGGAIEHAYVKTDFATTTIQVTVQGNNTYFLNSGTSVTIKLIRRNST